VEKSGSHDYVRRGYLLILRTKTGPPVLISSLIERDIFPLRIGGQSLKVDLTTIPTAPTSNPQLCHLDQPVAWSALIEDVDCLNTF
jgi:hypothetical protein